MTPMEYIAAYAHHIDALAHRFDVNGAIHPDDYLLIFLLHHPRFADKKDCFTEYFEDGAACRNKLESLKKELLLKDGYTLLEFASGYGRVTRHLMNSSAELWACDIHPAAIDFLQREISARAFISSPFPETLQAPRQFDVVFALSLFSHLPITTWVRWLVRLVQATRPGGFVIFTTHGLKTRLPDGAVIPSTGFWFSPGSEQHDLPNEQYGITITTPAFVEAAVNSIDGVKLIKFDEAAWWGHQDLYVLHAVNTEVSLEYKVADSTATVKAQAEQNAALVRALSELRDSKTWKLAAPLWRLETHGRRKAERRKRSTN